MAESKREEQTKLEVARSLFAAFDTTRILGNIDFSVAVPEPEGQTQPFETEYLLWAEAKRGTHHRLDHSLVQLIITIGKARTYLHHLPPAFLGAFDEEKIAFLPYYRVADIFTTNDFDWKVAPSDHSSREFAMVLAKVEEVLRAGTLVYCYGSDAAELRQFIKDNFVVGKSDLSRVRINKNNFTSIYQKWRAEVMPTVKVNWEEAKKQGVIAADFYLADILAEHNSTLLHRLYVLLRSDHYEFARRTDEATLFNYQLTADFTDGQEAHRRFWARYDRPPRREYWDYIVERRDLLVPQDVRERKGSFFTPQRWVELSQRYLADELGDDWQDRYYIWDCCAGTGNLLAGLTNRYNIYASTLDRQDVDVMHERIHNMEAAGRGGRGGSNLLESHVFQFDFLNDPFFDETDRHGRTVRRGKVPASLQRILADPEERKRLVIYINPPYAEAGDAKQPGGTGRNKEKVATETAMYSRYQALIGKAAGELFAQFFIRIACELPGTVLAEFSTLKILQAPNFEKFRKAFQAQLGRFFLVPAKTFDNVRGDFPIGFFIWRTGTHRPLGDETCEVYKPNAELDFVKTIHCARPADRYIGQWLAQHKDTAPPHLGMMDSGRNDFQHAKYIRIERELSVDRGHALTLTLTNLHVCCVYFAVRHCIEATWLNDRDQFLYPADGWQDDHGFQADCLVYTLFHGQNRISSRDGANHWIPFTEEEAGAQERFESHLMADYLRGALPRHDPGADLFSSRQAGRAVRPLDHLSPQAQAVMQAGRALWRYYHRQPGANPDASFYDIRLHFQGTKPGRGGKPQMNPASPDAGYTALLAALREAMRGLAKTIEPKVYQYGFLK